ncbi:glycosyltransferase family 87 protein [Kocuria sp.]|uniref:glycosyltransferase family 87 protein n=1 Tax=Kocuria sp. TaxID=1871328 RepID=UPI0026E00C7B|nr:glycosyltransferase 87 family protein [Kocuria sp.]MDO5618964.1 glycosyltransferase 87 family protein [Kocuria sp.]
MSRTRPPRQASNSWVPLGSNPRFWVWSLVGLAVWTMCMSWLIRLSCHQITWQGDLPFQGACYSDLPTLYRTTGMVDGNFPYLAPEALLEYPVLQTVIASITGVISYGISGDTSVHAAQSIYFDVNFALLLAVWVITVLLLARMVAAPRFAVVVALAPAVAATATINWDLWPVFTAVAALWFFRKERWVLGGVMLGLGTALKLWPFVMLGALMVLAIRQRRFGPVVKAGAGTVLTWVGVNLPFYLLDPTQWNYFWSFSSDRGAGFSSVYHVWNVAVVPYVGGQPLATETINMMAYGGFALCCVGVLAVGLLAPRTPSIEQLSLLIVAAFVLTNKVYSPQFVLWLVPLVILARPKMGQFLVWQIIEVFHWIAIFSWLHNVSSGTELVDFWTAIYAAAVILHVVAVVAICAATVMDILRGRAPQDIPRGRAPKDLVDPGATVNPTNSQHTGAREAVTHG